MNKVGSFVCGIPFSYLLPTALILGLAPFSPEPHLTEKVRLLFAGMLVKPLDVLDLLLHAAPLILLVLKIYLTLRKVR